MQPDITTGLLLAYNFSAPLAIGDAEYVIDQSGNGYDIRIKTNWRSTGRTGSGLYQDIDIPVDEGITIPSYGLQTYSRTVMFWAKIGAEVNNEYGHAVWMFDGSGSCWAIATQEPGGNVWFRATELSGPAYTFTGVPKFPAGEWHHYAMTYTYPDWRCYIDGAEVHSEPIENGIVGADPALRFLLNGTSQQTIDDVRMYDRALSLSEIVFAKDTPVAGSLQPQRKLLAEYAFEEGSGAIAGDGSGRGNHATLYGAEEWTVAGHGGGGYGSNATPTTSGFDLPQHLTPHRFTVMCWYKSVSYPTNEAVLFSVGGFNGKFSLLLAEAGFYQVNFMGSNFASAPDWRDGAWHHVAVTYDGATVVLYIDGTAAGSNTYAIPFDYMYGGSWNLLYGSLLSGNRDKGIIDDARLFSYALTPIEVANWMGIAANPAVNPTRFWRNPSGNWVPLRTTTL